MNLYYVFQNENTGESTYHAMIVAAETEKEARLIHPDGDWDRVDTWTYSEHDVHVKLIGYAAEGTPPGVVLSSFS
tara:strand:+ start:786 stop:1010 length:225 start_codon:yes stop_codon:yes gene_type:complete